MKKYLIVQNKETDCLEIMKCSTYHEDPNAVFSYEPISDADSMEKAEQMMQHIKDIGGIQKYFDEIVGSVKNKKKDTSKKSIAENVEIEKPAIPRNYLNQTTLKKFQIQLNEMEERLVTRFKWGLTVNITPPDFETRVAILTNKIRDYDYHFPPETIEYLAGQFDSNVRDLEGALKDISLVANVRQLDTITVEVAAEAIRARKMDGPKLTLIPIEDIQTEVGKFYNVTVKEIKATKRTQNIVLARQVAMYLAREMTDNSLPKIGKEFGGRDHSTVLHAYNKIKNMIAQDDSLRIEIDTIKNKIK